MTNKEFIAKIAPIMKRISKERGYKIVSVAIAQACLESNFGRSTLSYKYNNHFGMKCGKYWRGKSVNLKTKEEYTVGTLTEIRDNFRVYDTFEDGCVGYYDFIATQRYSNLKSAGSAYEYAHRIKEDGYATDSSYVSKLISMVEKYALDAYDVPNSAEVRTATVDEIAREVIAGKWGNGLARKQLLTGAGYDYKTIQTRVNQILRGK